MRRRSNPLNKKGTTLVEMIVTFVLVGLFLLAASTALTAGMNVFYRMQAVSRAIVVSDTILDKAQGELSAASADGAGLLLGGTQAGDGWWDTICFYTAEGRPAAMKSVTGADGNGIFILYYDPVKGEEGRSWTFDEKLYQGFSVTSLLFRWTGTEQAPGNVIEIKLELSKGTTVYTQTRYAECSNFFKPSQLRRIKTGVSEL